MIKAVIFDLGNVILFYDHLRSCNKLADISGHSADEISSYIFSSGLKTKFDRGEIEPAEFYSCISKQFGLNISFKQFSEIWEDIFWLNEPMTQIIRQLKKQYKLYILSNTDVIHLNYFTKMFSITKEFDYLFASCELKLAKPDPEIYKTVLNKIKLSGEECIYLDDAEEFINAGKQAGMFGIVYKNMTIDQLKEELKKLGIN